MQLPPVRRLDCDTGVARQRDEEHAVGQPLQLPHRLKAEPALATLFGFVEGPALVVSQVRAAVAHPVDERLLAGRPRVLCGEAMHRGVREVGDAACVVEVEVCGDDVADIAGPVAERRQLLENGARARGVDAGDAAHEVEPTTLRELVGAEAGVDEHQPGVRLDQPAAARLIGTLCRV